ncbi:hypothetical protein E5N72_08655 [Pseudoalteromonas sp. MEBiC 03607]|uniref:hypothetical protein n=1 Tax=Pseudoalteromonas sp. MEBiC 03607 TaxID=2563601 RepID=UPI00109394C2|nr:hypothetical protein [Pseudoalteromonas sp. MEBiC 03607]TGV20140.1 hypothetical protein E5N72_08655 [Pseudoalteromonas sp. MEBiC 03607]
MGRARKVPLSTILPVKEVTAREPLDSGSKAKADALESLTEEHRKAIASGTERDVIPAAQGPSIGASIPPLLVAKPPKDLPENYKNRLTEDTLVLVDGYQRYKAIKSKHGLEVRVSIKEVEGNSMVDLMLAALEANYQRPLVISANEKKAHVFRLLLLGAHTEGADRLMKKYGDVFSRSTLAEYISLARFARTEANLEDLPLNDVKVALRGAIKDTLGDLLKIKYDAKGFPTKSTVKAWRMVLEGGDITPLIERAEKERERTKSEAQELAGDLSYILKGASPKAQVQALSMYLMKAKEQLDSKPDDSFLEYFGED